MIANWMLSIISCYLACFAHRFSSDVAFFSRTSAGSLPRGKGTSACMVDASGLRAAARPDWHRRRASFAKICFITTIRLAKTKFSTSVQLFCDCGLPSVLCEAEMGRYASDLPLFRASIRVLTPRGNPQSQKSCNFGRISVFGLPDRLRAGVVSGVARARRLCGRLWAAFCPLWSWAFSLAASAGALALIPSQRQLHCGIMIRTVSKEL